MTAKPEKVRVLVARMKRKGVLFTLVDGGVRVEGWRRLPPEDKAELRADRDRIVAWLESREFRRQRRAKRQQEQQQSIATAQQPQRERRVIGQIVSPGRPLRLLFEDETTAIDTRTARVLKKVSYGWLVGGDE